MKKIINVFIIYFVLSLCFITNVYASNFSISASTSLTKGSKTTLKITGKDAVGRFNISTSNSSVVSISESYVWVENNTVSVSLSALKVGSAKITVTAFDVSNNSGSDVSLGSKSITINVSLPREKSSNNYLKGLTVDGYDLIPSFDKNTLEYNVSVPATTEKVVIGATKEDKYASVNGTGEFEVNDGVNNFEISVTSETGAVKVYAVNVTVEDLNPIEVKTDDGKAMTLLKSLRNIEAPINYVDKQISINGITIPAYYNEKNAITLVGLKDDNGVSLYRYKDGSYSKYNELVCGNIQLYVTKITNVLKGYSEDDITINDSKISALRVSKESNFAVIYGIDIATGNEGYFTYDINNNTIQSYDSELIDELTKNNTMFLYILIICGSLLVISFVLIIVLISSNKKKDSLIKKYISEHSNTSKKNKNKDNVNEIIEIDDKDEKQDKSITKIDKKSKIKSKKVNLDDFIDDDLFPEISDEDAKISLEEVLKDKESKKKNVKK